MLELGKTKRSIVGVVGGIVWMMAAGTVEAKLPFKKAPCVPFEASGEWQAFVLTAKGESCSVAQPIERMSDKHWMFLHFTEYSGPRIRLAVMPVENARGFQAVPVDALEDMLGTALFNTNRVELIEREELGSALAEQDFGRSGRVTQQTAAATGKVLGADYQIHASVIEWSPGVSKVGGGAGKGRGYFRRRVSGAFNKDKAEIAMSFKVVDSTTTAVLHSTTVRATAGGWGMNLSGLAGNLCGPLVSGFGSFEKNSPVSYAVQAAMSKAVYQLAHWLKKRPWRGSVVRVEGNTLVLNAGSDKGIAPGMVVSVLHKGKEETDPETGLSMGARTRVIGTASVTTVDQRWSEAVILDGCKDVKRGDRIEMADGEAIARAPVRTEVGTRP